METITSIQNQKIKNYLKLGKARERKKQNKIIIEGQKELEMALKSGLTLLELYFQEEAERVAYKYKLDDKYLVTETVAKKLSNRENPASMFAVVNRPENLLSDIKLSKNPLVIIAEDLEKPGNIGAIIRTVDAIQADAFILTKPRTDIFNSNIIRTSRGAVFSTQIALGTNEEVLEWLKEKNLKIISSTPDAKKDYLECDYKVPCAILIGAEHEGLSSFWLEGVDEKVKIPMKGCIDSLNASVSTAVIAYEVSRQRNMH